MPDLIVDEPADTAVDGHRRAGVARAWRLGRHLADTIQQHDLAAPVTVHTHTGPTGRAWIVAEMTFAGLAALAHATRAHIRALGPGRTRAQIWIEDEAVSGVVEYVYTAGGAS